MTPETLKTAWKLQMQWSETANGLKREYDRWRLVVLVLTVVAAALGVLSAQFTTAALSVAAAVAAALSPVVAGLKLDSQHLHAWLRARSASEAIKSEIFRFLTCRGEGREEHLSKRQKAVLDSVKDISVEPRTDELPARAILHDLTPTDYLNQRVSQQIERYYRPKASDHRETAKRFKLAHLVLMLVGTACGSANAVLDIPTLGPWIAVASTIAAALLAHLAAGRHEYLEIAYRATADQLQNLRDEWLDHHGEDEPKAEEICKLVDACEVVISNQNQDWHAKLGQTSH
ncbi:DUF4231 domain-containing protein [Endothiovibrio diazotrophicus]